MSLSSRAAKGLLVLGGEGYALLLRVDVEGVVLDGVVLGLVHDDAADGAVLGVDVFGVKVRDRAEIAGILGVAVVEPVEELAPADGGSRPR